MEDDVTYERFHCIFLQAVMPEHQELGQVGVFFGVQQSASQGDLGFVPGLTEQFITEFEITG